MAPSSAQADVLDRQTSAARALWNLIHAHHTFYEGSKRWPSWTESDTAIRQARKDIDWLAVKQKSGLNRSILDQGWTQILALLTYKADQAGARVVAVRPHGTSQTCHQCRSTAKRQRENHALFDVRTPHAGGPETPTPTQPS
jgi:hypothetical protein